MSIRAPLLWAVSSVAALLAPAADGSAAPTFGLAGNDKILWVWQSYADRDQALPRIVLAHRRATPADSLFYRPPLDLVGQVRVTAVIDLDLLVIYGDGSQQLHHPALAGSSTGRVLPEHAVPIAICADAQSGAVYAVVNAVTASALISAKAEEEAEEGEESDGEAVAATLPIDAGEPVIQAAPPTAPPTTATSLVRLEGGRWQFDRELPSGVGSFARCWIAASRQRITALLGTPANEVSCWQSSGANWSAVTAASWRAEDIVAVLPTGSSKSAGILVDAVAVVLTRSGGAGAGLRPWRLSDGQWQAGTAFELPLASAVRADELAVARFGERVAIARLNESGGVMVGVWPVDGGPPAETPRAVTALKAPTRPLISAEVVTLLAGVALISIAALVVSRRRERFLEAAPLAAGQVPANPIRRGFALLLDLTFSTPLTVPVLLLSTDLTADTPSPWPPILALALFSLYASVSESLMGATPGKRAIGCRVVDENGQRCRLGAILLRNLLRMLEFYPSFLLLPPLALMLVTRNRQRLGDLIARTVVVQPAAAA